ncbi:fimbrial biogenesis chaperone [Anabaena sp. CA = ATCC 33047]|uniref:fimbrial biogenesis chaperone n=1 Tax=Anabaena sp. (strain CA / ATCC 33047) TaxID=52271 RepID=UPI000829C537|nr:fimbria/pilus periplasmic chaperone [Anabaena sp. CA = ATCC 33047]
MLSKFKGLTLGLIGALALNIAPAKAVNIGVTPPRFSINLSGNKTRTEAIRVLNLDSKPVELKVYVRSWQLDENNQLQVIPPNSEQSLDQWIVFTPSKFTIPAGGAQTVRFAIRPRVQPRAGEHRAVIMIEEVPPANSKSKGVRVVGKLGVAVYAYVGDIKRDGVLNSVNVDTKSNSVQASFDISSQGNAFVNLNGQYAIWPAAQYPGAEATKPIGNLGQPNAKMPENVLAAGSLPRTPVLPDSRRQIVLPINKTLPPGNYVLDINGDLGGVAINKGIPFTVPTNNNVKLNNRTQPNSQRVKDLLKNHLQSR